VTVGAHPEVPICTTRRWAPEEYDEIVTFSADVPECASVVRANVGVLVPQPLVCQQVGTPFVDCSSEGLLRLAVTAAWPVVLLTSRPRGTSRTLSKSVQRRPCRFLARACLGGLGVTKSTPSPVTAVGNRVSGVRVCGRQASANISGRFSPERTHRQRYRLTTMQF
jgi:hypothetical protein